MGGKIDGYVDTVSPYSWYAFEYLHNNKSLLSSHGVEVEFHPIFLGGIVEATGNRPPFTIPAKAKYSPFDSKRAAKYFGVEHNGSPPFFPILSLLPQRALTYIKSTHPYPLYESTLAALWKALHIEHVDISKPPVLISVLGRIFPKEEDVEAIMAATADPEIKAKLNETTKRALSLGAFGAPFFSVTKFGVGGRENVVQPFFGSDRFHYMFDYLDVPVTHLRILGKGEMEEQRVGKGKGDGLGKSML